MTEPGPACRALLMGNAGFPDEPGLRRLLGPANDLRLLGAALTDPEVGLPWNVTVVAEGTSQELREALDAFFGQAVRGDRLLLYYTGHGLLDAQNRLHLCTRDTTVDRLRTRAVRHSYVTELMDECAARSIVVVLDCCFSGHATAAKGADPAALFMGSGHSAGSSHSAGSGRGRFVMTSCGRLETAADAPTPDEPSPFTAHLVAGLRQGAVGEDGYVTVEDVYRYVDDRLRGSGQRPEMKTEGRAGHVPLARRPLPTAAAPEAARPAEPEAGAPAGRDTPDLRPVFTDAEGRVERPAAESHFTGVLHVPLPGALGTLTVHRDDLVAAGPEHPAQGWYFTYGPYGSRRKPVRLDGTMTASEGVRFALPDGAGTVDWPVERLAAFDRARVEGSWPTALRPTHAEETHIVLKSRDETYRMLAAETRTIWAALAACAVAAAEGSWLATDPRNSPVLVTIALFTGFVLATGGVTGLAYSSKDVRAFSRLRRLIQLPALPVTRMSMRVRIKRGEFVRGRGGGRRMPDQVYADLWCEDFRLTLPADHFGKNYLAVAGKEPRPVEVIGLPAPGQWVVVRTPHGMLWPNTPAERPPTDEAVEPIAARTDEQQPT
ncbi:caspase family protein [Streptomyces sp. CA-249302]|uniref:caspase family protein n=1 Tax=Streptomyces sp. CA-249302 TaxID=3240058 RepID=UPI003D90B0F9